MRRPTGEGEDARPDHAEQDLGRETPFDPAARLGVGDVAVGVIDVTLDRHGIGDERAVHGREHLPAGIGQREPPRPAAPATLRHRHSPRRSSTPTRSSGRRGWWPALRPPELAVDHGTVGDARGHRPERTCRPWHATSAATRVRAAGRWPAGLPRRGSSTSPLIRASDRGRDTRQGSPRGTGGAARRGRARISTTDR